MNSKMKIFKAEKEAGLAEQLRACSSVAYVSKLEPLDPATPFAVNLVKAVASKEHPMETLYPMRDVLVTTGWNLNTDVFDNGETWSARNTPVHHPLNFEHNEKRIIGNITASQAVDNDFNPISEDLAVDELPSSYHILNGSVIYRVWEDEAQQALINQTIAEIEKGEWFVSMECAFKGFDYAVVRPDGSTAIIPRDESSAFLTKHLRHYGGTGVYRAENNGMEFKLGRVLRNINFIGKGLVRQPANPNSIILNGVSAFTSSFANLGYIKTEAEVTSPEEPQTEKLDMSEVNADIKRLEDRVAELVKANETLSLQVKEHDGKAAKAEVETLQAQLKDRDTKINTLEASKLELAETVKTLTTRAEKAEADLTTVTDEVTALKAEKTQKTRLDLLTGKGATQEKAQELVTKFAKFSDEDFNALVETISVAFVKKNETPTNKTPQQVIEGAASDKTDPALAAASQQEGDKEKERIAKAAKFIGSHLKFTKAPSGQVQE